MRRVTIGTLLVLCVSLKAAAQESRPGPERAELLRQARQAFEDQNWEEAVKHYRAVVKIDDKNGPVWHQLGYSLHMLNRLDEALEADLKAAEFPVTRSRGLYNAGCVYALRKDKDKAFDYLMQAAAAGFDQLGGLENDTDLNALHDDPRWEKLVAAVNAAEGPAQFFANPGERRTSRVVWFSGRGAPQAVVSYGSIAWKDAYTELIKSDKLANKRWRLGRDFWTTLDTSLPMTVGEKNVPAGYYYLTLERRSNGDYVLAFVEAEAVRKQKLDAFVADRTKGGIEVTLKHEALPEPASRLDIALAADGPEHTKGALTIKFGPNKLSAPVVYQLSEK